MNLTFRKAFILASAMALGVGLKAQYTITTFAGTGSSGYNGDGMQATLSNLDNPTGVAFDAQGNAYISDYNHNRIRKVDGTGVITTFAGTGVAGSMNGTTGPGGTAQLNLPSTMVFYGGDMYIVDAMNHQIRKVTMSTGMMTTVVGSGSPGYSGDSGPAINAQLNFPCGIAFDASGNMYIADRDNHCVRKVSSAGIITTAAGTGNAGYNGDNQLASIAELNTPNGVTLDAAGNLYIADENNHRIRKVNSSGFISTVAGTGISGFSGNNGQATSADFGMVSGVTHYNGDLYISDFSNAQIRKVNIASGLVTAFAGNGTAGFAGDGGPALLGQINLYCEKVSFDAAGTMYIPDSWNQRIRAVKCETCNGPITGMETSFDKSSQMNVNIFPNPSQGSFNLSGLKINEEIQIKITDVTGRIIFNKTVITTGDYVLDLPADQNLYFMQLKDGSGSVLHKKLVVAR
jgi:sugar lactone lactonase YvrE